MFILYDLIFLIFSVIYLPIYLFRRKFHRGFLARLGALPKNLTLEHPIWIHAVSVGEAMAVRGLAEELRKKYPKKQFVISTVTATGNKIACGMAKSADLVTYLPLDFSIIVKKVIHKIKPSLFIIAETEIWPNLISCLYSHKIPTVIVNGRISDFSYKGYRIIKCLLKPILNKVTLFCVQTPLDAERLMRLGVLKEKIRMTGNLKFDVKFTPQKYPTVLKSKISLGPQEKLFVAGSTHSGEEEVILGVYKKLKVDFPNLKLLIAPRHPERSKEVAKIASSLGFHGIFVSTLPYNCATCITAPVFILDTVGELVSFYSVADIVFVGGSLIKKGGHNILEPAAQGKPVLFGPHMFNFRDIAELFLKNQAAIVTPNPAEMEKSIRNLLQDPALVNALTRRAEGLILQNQGATQKTLEYISP